MVKFNDKLTIYETAPTEDGQGGYTEGTKTKLLDLWGKVKLVSQKKQFDNGVILTASGVEITCRYFGQFDLFGGSDADLQKVWQVDFKGQEYRIHLIEDVGFDGRFVKITAWRSL